MANLIQSSALRMGIRPENRKNGMLEDIPKRVETPQVNVGTVGGSEFIENPWIRQEKQLSDFLTWKYGEDIRGDSRSKILEARNRMLEAARRESGEAAQPGFKPYQKRTQELLKDPTFLGRYAGQQARQKQESDLEMQRASMLAQGIGR